MRAGTTYKVDRNFHAKHSRHVCVRYWNEGRRRRKGRLENSGVDLFIQQFRFTTGQIYRSRYHNAFEIIEIQSESIAMYTREAAIKCGESEK